MAPPARAKKEPPRPIIVRKITVVAAGHHGGAWKVAYADFVTAMMAFFLLLWLLGATTEKQRKGIADYFSPTLVKMRQVGAGSNGLLGGSSITDVDKYAHRAGQTGTKAITVPRDASGGPKEGGSNIKRMASLQQKLKAQLALSERLKRLSRSVNLMITPDGIRIDLLDNTDFSMFELGTTVLTPDAAELLRSISATIKDDTSGLTIRGHTDALQWRGGVIGTNNWSLSAGRADATRQAMMVSGVAGSRFHRIEGVADREPLIKDNPGDPRNRRISIMLTN